MPLKANFDASQEPQPFKVDKTEGVGASLITKPESEQPAHPAVAGDSPARSTARSTTKRGRGRKPSAAAAPTAAASYTGGKLRQTSVNVDVMLTDELTELAAGARISLSSLLVAVLHAGLAADVPSAAAAALSEQRSGGQRQPIGPRMPQELRDRLDELTAAVKHTLPTATRADLVNAALRTALPLDVDAAVAVHDAYLHAGWKAKESTLHQANHA